MTESCSEALLGTWAPPESPFQIAYSFRALDDIRLSVIDAFFSLPRGGAEIGGILLGKRDAQQVMVLDYVALDCEHALGPSFSLSPKDLAQLSLLLEEARKNTPDLQPIGWYHSHTRSEIFLSEADVEIHKRYFPAPWQVALVLKPHTFHPTRAGFFFRDADGSFHTKSSYLEFVLDPLPIRPLPTGIVPPMSEPGRSLRLDSSPTGRVITMPATVISMPPLDPEPVAAPEPPASQPPEPEPVVLQLVPVAADPRPAPVAADPQTEPPMPPVPVPQPPAPLLDVPIHFADLDSRPRWGVTSVLVLAACVAIGALGYTTRQAWLPKVFRSPAPVAAQAPVATSLGLLLSDQDGQLRIAWDRQSAAVLAAARGTLEISAGGGIPSATRLDPAQLQSGSFTYKRETEKVDVVLSLEGPNGDLGHESVSFLGKLPEAGSPLADPEVAKQRDALALDVERLKGELKAQTARNQQLLNHADQRGDMAAEVERLKNLLAVQSARTKELEKVVKPQSDQLSKLRSDLNVQISHNRVLAQALDAAQSQLKLQQKKRLSNQNADSSKQ